MGVCASTPKADAEPEAKVSHRKNVPTPAEVADAAVLEARRARYAVLLRRVGVGRGRHIAAAVYDSRGLC